MLSFGAESFRLARTASSPDVPRQDFDHIMQTAMVQSMSVRPTSTARFAATRASTDSARSLAVVARDSCTDPRSVLRHSCWPMLQIERPFSGFFIVVSSAMKIVALIQLPH